ncbi:MAG TPA: TonB-dependent receptor [Ignavibacteriales bacterium]|nr:TonB-dependent receptor [Ignavibacteriales bacterium]
MLKKIFIFLSFSALIYSQSDSSSIFTLLKNNSYSSTNIKISDKNAHNYKFLGDLLSKKNNVYIGDLGNYGQPYSINVNGVFNNLITYMLDGVEVNDPIHNNFKILMLQSTSLDQIEILDTYKAFIYSNNNSLSAINFKTNYLLPYKPKTIVKYTQSSGEDAQLETSFFSLINDKLYFNFNLSSQNNETDNTTIRNNSNYWKINPIFIYKFDNYNQIELNYKYNQAKLELNGGIDVNTITNNFQPEYFKTIFYDNNLSPIIYKSLSSTTYDNILSSKYLFQTENLNTSTNFLYYNSNLQYKNNNSKISEKFKMFTLSNEMEYFIDDYEIFYKANYRHNQIELDNKYKNDEYSLSALLKRNFNFFNFSIFSKYNKTNNSSFSYGLDFAYNPEKLLFKIGYSKIQNYQSSKFYYLIHSKISNYEPINNSANVFSLNIKFQIDKFYNNFQTDYLTLDKYQHLVAKNYNLPYDTLTLKNYNLNILNFNNYSQISFANFMISNNFSFNIYKNKDITLNIAPKIRDNFTILYFNSAYNGKLNFKTGIEVNYFTKTDFVYYDYFNQTNIFDGYENYFLTSDPKLCINLFLNANIIKKFTLTFTIDNLLDYNYTIMPNFPIYGRNYKLGIWWELET